MNPLVIARWIPVAKQVYELGELIVCRIRARRAQRDAAAKRAQASAKEAQDRARAKRP